MVRIAEKTDVMAYLDGMEAIESDVIAKVREHTEAYQPLRFSAQDVQRALARDALSVEDYGALLSPAAEGLLEDMAFRAMDERKKHFGNSVSLFTPLYIANYCENECIYCGFNCKNVIQRGRLSIEEIEGELEAIAKTGLKEILLLTGEARKRADVKYIGEAVKLSRKYFSTIGVEIYPLNTDEYAYIHGCGADFVSVYQETYDTVIYEQCHRGGPKRSYPYRFNAQERALMGGMRGVAFGCLLGLGDFRADALSTGLHAHFLQQKYPHAEVSFSVPRIRAYVGGPDAAAISPRYVGEKHLLQVLLAYRIFMPYASVTISTRERAGFRDRVIALAATKISAGVKVSVGGHESEQKGDGQFEIADPRDVAQVHEMVLRQGMQPVYTDNISLL